MSVVAPERYAVLAEPATLTLQRLLPGPIERVWDFLTRCELRKQWLAAGEMSLHVGAPFELIWRNDELSDPPGQRPAGFDEEHRMASTLTEVDPPHRLAFTWSGTGDVVITLEAQDEQVLLTLRHHRLPDNSGMRLNLSAGWHAHLDILQTRLEGDSPAPFWPAWQALKRDYQARLPQE